MSERRKLGPFDVDRQLGVGGMGVVYLASHRDSGQHVALKVLSPAFTADKKLNDRFVREIEILKKLDHPNIVRYLGSGRSGEQRYYAMEYMDGGSLDTVLERKGQLTWEQTIKVGLQLCSALEHAHANGIVHRDLKPGNLFITKKGRLRLGDFGIARDNDATALTAAGKTVGTYAYMAPEQIHGKAPIGPKTDIYAMGCLLFQFLTGEVPFVGGNAAEMFMKHLDEAPASVCERNFDCPIWLDRVIQRMLAKDPDDRPFDALAVQQLLQDVRTRVEDQSSLAQHAMTGGPVDTVVTDKDRTALRTAIGTPKRKKKKKKKEPLWERGWFLALCLILVVGGVTYALWPPSEAVLFQRIQAGMKVKDDWTTLQGREIASYLERFPDGEHSTEVRIYNDEIDMNLAERRAMKRVRTKQAPKTEAEARYVEAKRFEDFGDRLTALQQYESIANLFKDREDDRAFVNLANKNILRIREAGTPDRIEIVNSNLRKADELARRGELIAAEKLWDSVVNLYGDNQELSRQAEYARQCLKSNGNPPPFEFGEATKEAPQPPQAPMP